MDTHTRRSLIQFFLLAVTLVAPFWLIGATIKLEVLPGVPLAGLAFFSPGGAAAIVVYRQGRGPGIMALVRRSFDLTRNRDKAWYAPTLLLMPAVLSFGVIRLSGWRYRLHISRSSPPWHFALGS